MASRIIETYEIGSAITRLVRESNSRVRLVSPYLNLKSWKHLEDAIADAARRKVDVQLLYRRDRRDEYQPTVDGFLRAGVKVYDWEKLHAKLYLGDDACIITSMNLDGSSAVNSEEFAMLSQEASVVTAVSNYVDGLFRDSRAAQLKPKGLLHTVASKVVGAAMNLLPESPGFCIRCHKDVPFDPERPLCDGCFNEWNKYKKGDYPERYCLSCGEKAKTSFERPRCLTCFKKETAAYA